MTTDTTTGQQKGTTAEPTARAARKDPADQPPMDTEIAASPRIRGRHRRPRPRKALLAAGGLALAAGVLSLVRLAPEYAGGSLGTAEAEPHAGPHNPGAETARTTRPTGSSPRTGAGTATPPQADPTAHPSATTPMGGTGPVVPTPQAPSPAATHPPNVRTTAPTTAAETPNPPAPPPVTTPHEPSSDPRPTTHPAQRPTPVPSPGTHTPENPQSPAPPSSGGGNGLCLPIIGLCVDVD